MWHVSHCWLYLYLCSLKITFQCINNIIIIMVLSTDCQLSIEFPFRIVMMSTFSELSAKWFLSIFLFFSQFFFNSKGIWLFLRCLAMWDNNNQIRYFDCRMAYWHVNKASIMRITGNDCAEYFHLLFLLLFRNACSIQFATFLSHFTAD